MSASPAQPLVGVVTGSRSDWETMSHATKILDEFNIPYEMRVVSAHRTPDLLMSYAGDAEEEYSRKNIRGRIFQDRHCISHP